jgi:hypothetical protein
MQCDRLIPLGGLQNVFFKNHLRGQSKACPIERGQYRFADPIRCAVYADRVKRVCVAIPIRTRRWLEPDAIVGFVDDRTLETKPTEMSKGSAALRPRFVKCSA